MKYLQLAVVGILANALMIPIADGFGPGDVSRGDGASRSFWNRAVVLLANVRDITREGDDCWASLEPFATVSGNCDATSLSEVKVRMRYGFLKKYDIPELGDRILIVLLPEDGPKHTYRVPEVSISFAKTDGPICNLKGLTQDEIVQFARKVREMRGRIASQE